MTRHRVDLCVIGAGSGGLSIAAGASQMGASVVLIERDRMGGDCLNVGCVPSKALIAAAGAAEAARGAGRFGIRLGPPEIDFARVHGHVHGTIAAIAPHDSVERFEALGVTVIQEHGRFTGPRTVAAGGHEIEARRFVIATGSRPAAPPTPGLGDVPYLTNETVFERTVLPSPLIVIGGGPIGLELAQAHRRLGAEVTVLEMFTALGKDDPELAEIVVARLRKEGTILREGVGVTRVAPAGDGIEVEIEDDGKTETLAAADLLVAAGRRPNIDDLGLEAAGIERDKAGLVVDDRLRTTNRRVYAAGDAAGKYQFTHVASYHAGIVIRNALFRLPAKIDDRAVPWVTYTDPELAHVGMTEAVARERVGDIRVLRFPFAENDRAWAERATDGLVKVVTSKKGAVLGASIVGAHAGELIQTWILPVARAMHVKHVAGLIMPYPTLGEANKRAAGSFFTPTLFGPRMKRIVRLLARLG